MCLSVFSNFGADRHARDHGLEEELGGGQGKDRKVEGIKAFQAILASPSECFIYHPYRTDRLERVSLYTVLISGVFRLVGRLGF